MNEATPSLSGIELFDSLAESDRDGLARSCRWHRYTAHQFIVGHQDETNDVYFIVGGRVHVTVFSPSGKEVSFRDLPVGKSFGELAAIDGRPRVANVIALKPSLTASLSKSDFWQTINRYEQVAGAVLQRLAFLVRLLCDRVYQHGALDVKDRVRLEILRLARNNMTDENSAVIPHMPTHFEIASRINTHREAVTRELNELSRVELIEQKKRVLAVKNVSRLAELLPEDV